MHVAPTTIVAVGGSTGAGAVCTPWGCLRVALLVETALASVPGVLFALAALSYLTDAGRATREERDRVRAEIDALRSFADRVRTLSPDRPVAGNAGRPASIVRAQGTRTLAAGGEGDRHRGTDAVRAAYRETVMAVDHYAEDYGEPLDEHLRSEFGPTVGDAVASGGELSPDLQRAVVTHAETAAARREAFCDELAAESDDLAAAADSLSSIESALASVAAESPIDGFDALADRWRRLERLERACADAVEDRRASLAERDAFDLASYLYADDGPPFPVLASAASLAADLREERRRTADTLTRVV